MNVYVCMCVFVWVFAVIPCVRLHVTQMCVRKRISVDRVSRTKVLRTSVVLLVEVVYTVPRREYVLTLIPTSTSRAHHEKAFFREPSFQIEAESTKEEDLSFD